jgi:hypothetical protein
VRVPVPGLAPGSREVHVWPFRGLEGDPDRCGGPRNGVHLGRVGCERPQIQARGPDVGSRRSGPPDRGSQERPGRGLMRNRDSWSIPFRSDMSSWREGHARSDKWPAHEGQAHCLCGGWERLAASIVNHSLAGLTGVRSQRGTTGKEQETSRLRVHAGSVSMERCARLACC